MFSLPGTSDSLFVGERRGVERLVVKGFIGQTGDSVLFTLVAEQQRDVSFRAPPRHRLDPPSAVICAGPSPRAL